MKWQFTKGVHDIGSGCFAYLQPNGGWGYSNAGLITHEGGSMLIDTLIDLPLTREMLTALRRATPAADNISTLLNTHAHPDHTNGNSLITGAEIIASEATAREMLAMENGPMKRLISHWQEFGEGGAFMHEVMGGVFELNDIPFTPPTRTFETDLILNFGSKEVRLIKVGPAHTQGDTLTYIPADRVVFTGDILFHQVHPLLGMGSSEAWINALDLILSWDVEVVVPGHGPIADKDGVRGLRDYFIYLREEARKRFDVGMTYLEAARDISLDAFKDWPDEERVYSNINAFYREFGAEPAPFLDVLSIARAHRHAHGHGCSAVHGATKV